MIQSQLKCIMIILCCLSCFTLSTYENLDAKAMVPMLGFLIKNLTHTIDKTYYYCGAEFCTEAYSNYHSIVVIIET